MISFRMDWLDLLAVQGTLKSLLQHHGSKASILRCSAFFTIQLSHPYMTNGKTIALTRWTFVGKVMSLLLNMLSRLVITKVGPYFLTFPSGPLRALYLSIILLDFPPKPMEMNGAIFLLAAEAQDLGFLLGSCLFSLLCHQLVTAFAELSSHHFHHLLFPL